MKTLAELVDTSHSSWPAVQEWIARAVRPVEVLPPSASRGEVLLATQVTTRSPMGAIVYETGGILVDHGWLRLLGSGHPRLSRTLPDWNLGKANGFYLIADDAAGGFFAMNGGAFGPDARGLYYFAPDSLKWEAMNCGYSAFLELLFTGNFEDFCKDLKWAGWEADVAKIDGDSSYSTYPPPWTEEGRGKIARRFRVPVEESWGSQMDFAKQIGR